MNGKACFCAIKTAYAFFFLGSSTKNENVLKIYVCNVVSCSRPSEK
ncbi:hypothetical protein NEISUBOT_03726 [Neisseria subflava NJ9703]|uniref:Uncharacterized protein n=1 Tax=Neisseria subflava NJ9703 TaxID=546268 RepID=A0A9W5ISF4_NEISU|nr:hypothetical protein NEISUBOT_03726 [Neisseria subflava NJ9703]